ncbi:MAG: hypothetical protein J5I98_27350 [Phaeodactylibacter sp.]|nr:hypothetical protein [Phaeodactylibacter sp.]
MKYIILAAILAAGLSASGQIKPGYFPEDVTSGDNGLRCYCKPGVRNKSRSKGIELSYSYFGSGAYKAEDTLLSMPLTEFSNFSYLDFSIKAPLLNKDNFKILLSYSYLTEAYNIERFGPDFSPVFQELDDSKLKSTTLGAIIAKPLDEFHYLAFRFRLASNGNYPGLGRFFEDRYAIYKLSGVYVIKPSDDLEWGLGLAYSKSFRRNSLAPFLLLNRNFSEKWGVESIFPANAYLRYNLSPDDIFLFGAEYDSQSYRILMPGPNNGTADFAMNHSEFLVSARAEHKFADWFWGNLKFGYRFNFSTDFESKSPETTSFNVDPSNAFFLQAGLFLSPPDRLKGD